MFDPTRARSLHHRKGNLSSNIMPHRHTPTTRRERWSHRVTEKSDALDLEHGVFAHDDPKSIARSLKRSAERSKRRKSAPFRSAMSMLNFYINRAGRKLPQARL